MRLTTEKLAKLAIESDPRCIKDRLFFLAWCWSYEAKGNVLDKFKELLTLPDPWTIERERERYLENHPETKEKYERTDTLRKQILGQESLF